MKRSFDNQSFARSDEHANRIRRRIHGAVIAKLRPHMEKIDPNWRCCRLGFEQLPFDKKDHDRKVPSDGRLDLSLKFAYAFFNGPAQGDVDLMDVIETLIPEPLVALLRVFDAYEDWHISFTNPKHQIQLIPGRVLIGFENCMDGYVKSVDGEQFTVEILGMLETTFGGTGEVYEYTLDQLKKELKDDGMNCQAVSVSYFPFLVGDGKKMETPVELMQHREEQAEINRAEMERRDAEREAMKPKREVDPELEARLAAQAEVARELAPHLPTFN